MGVSSPAGTARPRPARRSIRFTFAATVAVPTACMVVLWAVAVGLVLAGTLTGHGMFSKNHKELVAAGCRGRCHGRPRYVRCGSRDARLGRYHRCDWAP